MGVPNGTSLWELVWQYLVKLNIHSLSDAAVLLLGIYRREMKTFIHKDWNTNV